MAEAEEHHDSGRVERLRTELEFLAHELSASLGLGGRPRRVGDSVERARKAVTQRIRNSLRRLDRQHPELAAHLERSIRTGTFCSYSPERPVTWHTTTERS